MKLLINLGHKLQDALDTILDMEKDELAPEIEEEEVRQYRL